MTNKIGGETPKLAGEMHSKNKNHQKGKFSVHFWNKYGSSEKFFIYLCAYELYKEIYSWRGDNQQHIARRGRCDGAGCLHFLLGVGLLWRLGDSYFQPVAIYVWRSMLIPRLHALSRLPSLKGGAKSVAQEV